jgi:excisionase family DNA binding protein
MNATPLSLALGDEFLGELAERVAAVLAERPTSESDGFLDVEGAANFRSCPKSRIYSLVSAKRIPHHKDGSRLLFDREELREYVRGGGARRP